MRIFRALYNVKVGVNVFEKQFIYGGVYVHDDICTYIVSKDFEFKSIYKETLGQFTGIEDRNGVKIFEGDIVICDSLNLALEVCYVNKIAMFCLCLNKVNYGNFTMYNSGDLEVVGNIHLNKKI